MGHHDVKSPLTHRQVGIAQRRSASFVLVFTVVLLALLFSLSVVQHRDATCQIRAHEVTITNVLRPNLTRTDITDVVQRVLAQRHGTLDITEKEQSQYKTKHVDLFDTSSHILKSVGFRLVRWQDGNSFRWELRSLFDALCTAHPPISMEALPNVDYETLTYHSRGISIMNRSLQFMLQSVLVTPQRDRITSMEQLQNIFPGFNQLRGDEPLVIQQSWSYVVGGNGEVYFGGAPLDVDVHIQQWHDRNGSPLYWLVKLSTGSISAERNLESLQQTLYAALLAENALCITDSTTAVNTCKEPLEAYLS